MASIISNDLDRVRTSFDHFDLIEKSVEDVTIIWLDQYMDDKENEEDVEITKHLLRNINDYILFYSKIEPCLDYIQSVSKEKIFLITTGSYAQEHLEKIHHLKQIDSIFIFCLDREKYIYLKEKYSKIIDLFTLQEDLMISLNNNIELVTKQATAFGLFVGKERSTRYLTRESASFLWFQLLTDVLKYITLEDQQNLGIEEMLNHCRSYYRGNQIELNNIDLFRKSYKAEDAIVWYSKQSFVYRLVNKALRTEDIDALYTFRIYITHLRSRIAHEHENLRRLKSDSKSNIIHLYRGLKLTREEIHHMVENVGGLISMNGFFSTSRDIEQAIQFAMKKSERKNVFGVLLEISGDIHLDKMIFADIAQFSIYPKEQEVLFDLATIFKITHIEFDNGRNLWIIQLTGIEKSSYTVNEYIKSIAKENEESNPTLLLSRLMCDMGEYSKSEKYLKRLLMNLPSKHKDTSKIYFHLGRVAYFRGEYKQSLEYYSKALHLQKDEIFPKDESFDIAKTLHNIANIYFDQKQLIKALEFYEKSLSMKRLVLSNQMNHPSIATTLAAIGSVYRRQGNLEKALDLCKQSYEMKKITLVHDHPSLADSLNGLGTIYQEMDDSQQALDCFRKALKIKQKTLPSTHPSISATLNNMGIVYRQEGDYTKALTCYTQALHIEQATLLEDNLDLADTYNNLCTLYYDQSEFTKALEMAKCKLNILKKNFDDNHEQIKATKELIDEIKQMLTTTNDQKDSLEIDF